MRQRTREGPNTRVTFLNPGDESDPFFDSMVIYMRRAAACLEIELEVLDSGRRHSVLQAHARRLVERPNPPDYLLLVNQQSLANEILPRADARGIDVLLINEGLLASDRQTLGQPREKLDHWLGELLPDDRQAGQLLADHLIAAARPRAAGREIAVCGLGGSYTTSSLLRINGLRRAIAAHPECELRAVVPAMWEEQRARKTTAELLQRHPDLDVLWSASDQMAIGAAAAIAVAGGAAPISLGGIDWAPAAFEAIRRGTLAGSVGGHFLDGAWALVALFDFHHGDRRGRIEERSRFALATRANVDDFQPLVAGQRAAGIDFRSFSRHLDPTQERYRFDVEAVL